MSAELQPVLTIGHSNHKLEKFLDLLHQHVVSALVDVRSAPYSRFAPQFNRDTIEHALKKTGIRYLFLGKELGARSEDPSDYTDGRVEYGRLAQSERFKNGIARIARGAREYRIALMCTERDPLDCHRTLLVSRALEREGVAIAHILSDGSLEAQSDVIERLLRSDAVSQGELFRSKADLISEAIGRQEKRIAYVNKSLLSAGDPST